MKKKMNLLPDEPLFVFVPFQSIKNRKKELCVDNKVPETIGDVCCPTCRNEKCVYLPTNETSSFHNCRKCKACSHLLNVPFKDQKPTIMLFGVMVHNALQGKRVVVFEKKTLLRF